MGDEPIVAGYTQQQIFEQLVSLNTSVNEIKQTIHSGNFDSRISSLEQFKWKLIGGVVALNAVGFAVIDYINSK